MGGKIFFRVQLSYLDPLDSGSVPVGGALAGGYNTHVDGDRAKITDDVVGGASMRDAGSVGSKCEANL